MSYYRGGYRGLIPHPGLISRLCILGGVQGEWEEKENCPKTSPLTLTGITKGPKNRGRGSQVEAVQEEEEPAELQHLHLEGETTKLPQKQRGASSILPFSPEVRPVHQEYAEGFEPLRNNSTVLEMLNAMKQGMEEMDNQLKLQLQLRDEYMEDELRKRDQNLEEALNQRDEEWRSRWEQREQEFSEELKAREDAFIFERLKGENELFKIMMEMEDAMEKNMLQKQIPLGICTKNICSDP